MRPLDRLVAPMAEALELAQQILDALAKVILKRP
jgi:hypothetical protein